MLKVNFPKLVLPRLKKNSAVAGLPPGQLVHLGARMTDKAEVDLIRYNEKEFFEMTRENTSEIIAATRLGYVNWINVDGLHNVEFIKEIGEYYAISNLVLEDVLDANQRPKIENYDDYVFLTLKTLNALRADEIVYEQMSFVLGNDFLISFQEREGDLFDGLRKRLKNSQLSIARKKGADYLFYRLADTIVDSYYYILEALAGRIEKPEDEVYINPTKKTLQDIQTLKKELIILRKSVYPIREAIGKLNKGEHAFLGDDVTGYFSDVYDHSLHVLETLETYRDLTTGLMDMYMTSVSNKMNEVMKVLTVIATIFIPLTFIAGIYGMNFEYMPELGWKYGYAGVWGLMFTMLIVMMIYFKQKKWL